MAAFRSLCIRKDSICALHAVSRSVRHTAGHMALSFSMFPHSVRTGVGSGFDLGTPCAFTGRVINVGNHHSRSSSRGHRTIRAQAFSRGSGDKDRNQPNEPAGLSGSNGNSDQSRPWQLPRVAGFAAAGAGIAFTSMQFTHARTDARTVCSAASDDSSPPVPSTGESKSTGAKAQPPNEPNLVLISGGFMIPHPAKVDKGGEDAYYISQNKRSFGVADGVGGWADVGVDPGEFSRSLMRQARKAADAETIDSGAEAPAKILEAAYEDTRHIMGSSTACVVCLQGNKLHAANLGDSGFMVIRDGKLIFESPQQQHSFNFPFQLGSYGDSLTSCEAFSLEVKTGDIIVAGSDGLLDNVFNQRSAKLVWDAKSRGATPGVAAQQLATFAAARAKDPVYLSPFAKAARENGFYYQGGKVDDITVVVAYVTASDQNQAPSVSKL